MSTDNEAMMHALQGVQDAYGEGNVPMILIVETDDCQEVFAIVTQSKSDQLVLLKSCIGALQRLVDGLESEGVVTEPTKQPS